MKNYDYDKARRIIAENIENLDSASLGMHEDWFWTAETIWENGEFTKKLKPKTKIGGILGSSWATPALQLVFKDGSDKMVACYSGESDNTRPNSMLLGILSQPVQDNITPLSE